jgi:pimeloyl-ACP methyl ester carboxylesterase
MAQHGHSARPLSLVPRPPDLAARASAVVGRSLRVLGDLVDRRPFDEEWLDLDGELVHVEQFGTGPRVVVLLHGILLDSQMNHRLAASLADAGYRVVLVDLPGHGRSTRSRDPHDHRVDRYAEVLLRVLDRLEIERAVVGGVSLGANVSLTLAVAHPERVLGLLAEMPVLEHATPTAGVCFLPLYFAVWVAGPLLRPLSRVVRRLPRSRVGILDTFVQVAASDPSEVAAVLGGVVTGPLTPRLADRRALRVPTLVIGHHFDAVHAFADAKDLAEEVPGAQLVLARSVAELRLSPGRLTERIRSFLAEVWAGTPKSDAQAS